MGEVGEVDIKTASQFVCHVYGKIKSNDVDDVRHKKLIEMTGKVSQV